MLKFFATILSALATFAATAQDLHFSQMQHTPTLLNPALTGGFADRAPWRASVQHRRQWAFAPAYRDYAAALEHSGKRWQLGGIVYGNDAGQSSFQTRGGRFSMALNRPLSENGSALMIGFALGFEQFSIDPTDLTFESQYDAKAGFSPENSNGENFATTKISNPDAAAGLAWRGVFFHEKLDLRAGASLAHVQPTTVSFLGEPSALQESRQSWHVSAELKLSERTRLQPYFWQLRQGKFQNSVLGAEARVHFPEGDFRFGAARRRGDAWIGSLGADFRQHILTVSFDLNTSALRRAGQGQGAMEIGYAYFFGETKNPRKPAPKTPKSPEPKEICCSNDRDNDGVTDEKDRCPDEPGLVRLIGCPDADGDGLPNPDDRCPHLAGDPKNEGCPARYDDADNDGIADRDDACPLIPGIAEFRGCPDTDGDGVPDLADKCPFLKGSPARNGCPDAEALAENAAQNAGTPGVRVFFDTDKSEVKPRFFPELERLAAWLEKHPKARVFVAGHTDTEGDSLYNQQLGLRRAQAVEDWFFQKGIALERFGKVSYGENMPASTNDSPGGKARNRRVEVVIQQ